MKVVRLSALHTSSFYPPGNIAGTDFCQRLSWTQGCHMAKRIKSMKNSIDTIANWTCNFLACSVVPQPTTSSCAPIYYFMHIFELLMMVPGNMTYSVMFCILWEVDSHPSGHIHSLYKTWRFVTVFTVHHLSLSWANLLFSHIWFNNLHNVRWRVQIFNICSIVASSSSNLYVILALHSQRTLIYVFSLEWKTMFDTHIEL
jgi:hypothetical protein